MIAKPVSGTPFNKGRAPGMRRTRGLLGLVTRKRTNDRILVAYSTIGGALRIPFRLSGFDLSLSLSVLLLSRRLHVGASDQATELVVRT